jgi:hypothetical protein
MLSKCANPVCCKTFLYLRQGKLFRLEVPVDNDSGIELSGNGRARPATRVRTEHFWLCDSCCRKFEVICDQGSVVRTVPLRQYKSAS